MPTKQTVWSRNYVEKAYARLAVTIPKTKKAIVEKHAAANSESVNGLINRLLRCDMNMTEEEWKDNR